MTRLNLIWAVVFQTFPGFVLGKGCCCSPLSAALEGKVSLPSTPAYNASMEGFWTLQATFDTPACIVSPESAEDVATAVKVLVDGRCRFSIKGGGHTPFAGAASITSGVQIDMTAMHAVTVSEDRKVASIGPGARWGQVYPELEAQGLMVAGGRDSDVGVGGLILGGGYSWFTTSKGFVADGLVNVELVTADGRIINVNAEEHSDLFVALKGGGNNFGIATRFDLKAFEFPNAMWGGNRVYLNSTTDAHIKAFVKFNEKTHKDPHANLINYYGYESATGQHIVGNFMHYTKLEPNEEMYKDINAIPSLVDTTRTGPLSSFAEELSSAAQRNRNIFMTLTFDNDEEMFRKAVDISNHHVKPLLDVPGLLWGLLFQPVPTVLSEASKANGGNVMGVERNTKNAIMYLLFLTWHNESDDEAMYKAAHATINEIKNEAIRTGTDNPWIYLNYAGEHQDPLGSYGRANVKLMKKLARKYDPKGVFQKLVPGGWKLKSAKPKSP